MAQKSANEQDAIFAEEALVVEVQGLLHEIMEEKGISRADLARAMNVSRPRITQIFSDDCKNFTIRLLAKAMFALNEVPQFSRAKNEAIDFDKMNFDPQAADFKRVRWTEVFAEELKGDWACANDNIFDGLAVTRRAKASYGIAA